MSNTSLGYVRLGPLALLSLTYDVSRKLSIVRVYRCSKKQVGGYFTHSHVKCQKNY